MVKKEAESAQGFPKSFGEHVFQRTMKHPYGDTPYEFAVYEDPAGHRLLAKRWQGSVKDGDYRWLKSEARIGEKVTEIMSRYPEDFRAVPVSIARHAGFIEKPHEAILLMEFVSGNHAVGMPVNEQLGVFHNVLDFLRLIDVHLSDAERKQIPQRSVMHMIGMFPVWVVRAIVRRPKVWLDVRGVIVVITSFPIVRSEWRKNVFTHRDVHDTNILVQNGKAVLLDFQLAILTHPMWEIAALATLNWHKSLFREHILDFAKDRGASGRHFVVVFRFFVLYAAIVDIAVGRSERLPHACAFLRYGLGLASPKAPKLAI